MSLEALADYTSQVEQLLCSSLQTIKKQNSYTMDNYIFSTVARCCMQLSYIAVSAKNTPGIHRTNRTAIVEYFNPHISLLVDSLILGDVMFFLAMLC